MCSHLTSPLYGAKESTSEAVNGYYGVYLMGLARGDTKLADWGRLLLAMELRSAKKWVPAAKCCSRQN